MHFRGISVEDLLASPRKKWSCPGCRLWTYLPKVLFPALTPADWRYMEENCPSCREWEGVLTAACDLCFTRFRVVGSFSSLNCQLCRRASPRARTAEEKLIRYLRENFSLRPDEEGGGFLIPSVRGRRSCECEGCQ